MIFRTAAVVVAAQRGRFMEIVVLDFELLADVNSANEPFEVIGRIVPELRNGVWSWREELFSESFEKLYPSDDCDYAEYIDNPDKMIYLAYSDEQCIGQIILRRDWNRYAFIEDICVSRSSRGHGVGTGLIQHAAAWAKSAGLSGLALETQDNNVLACRFYAKCGFSIGGVNTMFYKNFSPPYCNETALFWYMKI